MNPVCDMLPLEIEIASPFSQLLSEPEPFFQVWLSLFSMMAYPASPLPLLFLWRPALVSLPSLTGSYPRLDRTFASLVLQRA